MNRRGFLGAMAASVSVPVTGCLSLLGPKHEGWPMYGYDAGNTGYRPGVQGIREEPSVNWEDPIDPDRDTTSSGEYDPPNAPGSSPAVVNGTAYSGTLTKGLVAYEAETGEEVWRYKDGETIYSDPAVVDGTAYIGIDNSVHAVDTETGEQKWSLDLDDEPYYVPDEPDITFYENDVYFARHEDIQAIDVETREMFWSPEVDYDDTRYHPAVAGDNVYYSSDAVRSFDAETGEEKWSIQPDEGSFTYNVVSDGVLYTYMGFDVWAIDAESGEKLWEHEIDRVRHLEKPAVDDEKVYVGGNETEFRALDVDTGEEVWSTNRDIGSYTPPTVTEDVVYADDDSEVTAFDTETGEELWQNGNLNYGGNIAVDGDSVYFTGLYENLVALN